MEAIGTAMGKLSRFCTAVSSRGGILSPTKRGPPLAMCIEELAVWGVRPPFHMDDVEVEYVEVACFEEACGEVECPRPWIMWRPPFEIMNFGTVKVSESSAVV